MLVEPELERVPGAELEELRAVSRGELLLGLAVELGAHDARREREAGAPPQVIRYDFYPFGRQGPRLHERIHRVENAVPEPRLVRAARARRDQVDVAVGKYFAFRGPTDRPGSAFAFFDLGNIGF